MKFTNFEMRMFQQARKEAEKGDYDKFHVGCVITYKHAIIGSGCNSTKSHPLQKEYNKKYRYFNNAKGEFVKHSLHAEICAISSIPFVTGKNVDFSKAKIFVYRICKGKDKGYGIAKPCPACMNAIREIGIKQVFFTDEDGYGFIQLD